MAVLSAQTIRNLCREVALVAPFCERTQVTYPGGTVLSFGLSACGYDIRVDGGTYLRPGEFLLASSLEYFCMPGGVMGRVHDKSSWARRGLAVQNTIIEPGWHGYLTLELTNHGREGLIIGDGWPIAQVIFEFLDVATEQPYDGKYQFQERGPQAAR